jgi:hypothetical protein
MHILNLTPLYFLAPASPPSPATFPQVVRLHSHYYRFGLMGNPRTQPAKSPAWEHVPSELHHDKTLQRTSWVPLRHYGILTTALWNTHKNPPLSKEYDKVIKHDCLWSNSKFYYRWKARVTRLDIR